MSLSNEEKICLLNTDDLYQVMRKVLLRELRINQILPHSDAKPEYFWVIGLAQDQQLLFIELLAQNHLQRSKLEPMEVFSLALQKRAARILLCHSRSGENLQPSEADKDLTNRLLQVGRIVKTPLLDHQIINTQKFHSMEAMGLLQQLRQSLKYVPNFELVQRIEQQAQEVITQRTAEIEHRIQHLQQQYKKETTEQLHLEKLKMAKRMQREGLQLEVIARILGLRVEDLGDI